MDGWMYGCIIVYSQDVLAWTSCKQWNNTLATTKTLYNSMLCHAAVNLGVPFTYFLTNNLIEKMDVSRRSSLRIKREKHADIIVLICYLAAHIFEAWSFGACHIITGKLRFWMSQLEFLKLQIAMGLKIHGHQRTSMVLLMVLLVSHGFSICLFENLSQFVVVREMLQFWPITFSGLPISVMETSHHRIPVDLSVVKLGHKFYNSQVINPNLESAFVENVQETGA